MDNIPELPQLVCRQIMRQYAQTREQQIKDAIIARGYQVSDWVEFAKTRMKLICRDNFRKDLYVDETLVASWSDEPTVG
jgi:hypothetical protein